MRRTNATRRVAALHMHSCSDFIHAFMWRSYIWSHVETLHIYSRGDLTHVFIWGPLHMHSRGDLTHAFTWRPYICTHIKTLHMYSHGDFTHAFMWRPKQFTFLVLFLSKSEKWSLCFYHPWHVFHPTGLLLPITILQVPLRYSFSENFQVVLSGNLCTSLHLSHFTASFWKDPVHEGLWDLFPFSQEFLLCGFCLSETSLPTELQTWSWSQLLKETI